MKYILGLMIILSISIPSRFIVPQAQAAVIENTVSGSDFKQYIILNCETERCQSWIQSFFEEEGDELEELEESEDQEIEDDIEEDPEQTVEDPQGLEGEVVVDYEVGQVVINEIMSAPLPSNPEWIELFNPTEIVVDLQNWKLVEGAGKKTSLSGEIKPGEYIVFDKSSLNNSGDMVLLEDPSGKIIDQVSYGDWDDGDLSDNAPVSESGNSIILFEESYKQTEMITKGQQNIFMLTEILDNSEDQESLDENEDLDLVSDNSTFDEQAQADNHEYEDVGEESLENDEESLDSEFEEDENEAENMEEEKIEYQFSSDIRINEIMADPEGSDDSEWIELYNTSDTDLDLLGWSLDDIDGGSQPYLIETSLIIHAYDYLIINKDTSKLNLNNTSDSVRLFDPGGVMIDSVNYEKASSGVSFAYFEDGWSDTVNATPNLENEKASLQLASFEKLDNVDYFPIVGVNEIKTLPLKSKVKIQGQVTALPGTFSKNNFYVNGSQVYYSKSEWPNLSLQDVIEITGTISESYSERRVLIKDKQDIQIVNTEEAVLPAVYSSNEITTDLVGLLIQLQGQVVNKQGSTLVLADEYGEFIVYLKQSTGLKASLFEVGEQLNITGILGQNVDELRLFPRAETDIENLTLQQLAVVGEVVAGEQVVLGGTGYIQTKQFLLFSFIGLLLLNFIFLWKYRAKVYQKVTKKIATWQGQVVEN